MIQRLKKLTQSRFIRSAFVVATGTAGAQAIAMAFAPMISRLYGPESFGLLGAFMALTAVLTPMAALTYPIAIVLPKQDVDAKGLANLSMLLAVITSALALIIILLWGGWFAEQFGLGAISRYLWLIPFAMLFSALHQVAEQWLIRHRQYRVTARIAVIQSALLNSAKASAGFFLAMPSVLIILQILGSGLHAFLLWLGIRCSGIQAVPTEETPNLKKLAIRHRDFPLFRAPEVTLNSASQAVPILVLAAFFGPASAGFFSLAQTVMAVPSNLVGKSVGDVFYPRISDAANNREAIYPLVLKATLLLAVVGLIPFVMIFIYGVSLFSFVFGCAWEKAGEYACWLSVWMFFVFINIPSVKAIPAINEQAFQLIFTIIAGAIRLAALTLTYVITKDDLHSVMVLGVVGALLNVTLIAVVLGKSVSFDRRNDALRSNGLAV